MAKKINLAACLTILVLSILLGVVAILDKRGMLLVFGVVLLVVSIEMFRLWMQTYYPKNNKER